MTTERPPITDADRMAVWLRETLDAAEKVANAAARRAWSPHWEYDRSVHEIRDLNNGNTLANIYFPAIGNFSAANDPAAVLRQIDRHRKLLDDLLAERHHVVEDPAYTCPAATTDRDGGQNYQRGPCDCGRDERAERWVRLLAEGWGWTDKV